MKIHSWLVNSLSNRAFYIIPKDDIEKGLRGVLRAKHAPVAVHGDYRVFFIYKSIVAVVDLDDSLAGYATFYTDRTGLVRVDSCFVRTSLVGARIGDLIYKTLLKKFRVLGSSSSLSTGSSKAWARLCKEHNGKLRVRVGQTYVNVDIVGWARSSSGHIFPKVIRDGNPVLLSTLLKSSSKQERDAAAGSFYIIKG